MGQAISFTRREIGMNKKNDEIDLTKAEFKKTIFDKIIDYFKNGKYFVCRCGFYKGNYHIHNWNDKNDVFVEEALKDHQRWVSFEGTLSECRKWVNKNQSYYKIEY